MTKTDFENLNFQFLVNEVERVQCILDRHLFTSYPEASVQFQHLEDTYGEGLSLAMLEQKIAEKAMDREGIRAQCRTLYGRGLPLERLLDETSLSPVAIEGFLLALSAVLEPGIRKRLTLIRDNILLGYVDVGTVLQIFADSPTERLKSRHCFEADSFLQQNRLIELALPKDALSTDYLLAREIRIPSRVESFVLGRQSLDTRVAPYARVEFPVTTLDRVVLRESELSALLGLLDHLGPTSESNGTNEDGMESLAREGRSLVIHLQGIPGTGKTLLVEAVAERLHKPLISVDSSKLAGIGDEFSEVLDRVFFEVQQLGAILCLEGAHTLLGEGSTRTSSLMRHFETHEGIIVLTSTKSLGFSVERWIAYRMKLPLPDSTLREQIWKLHLPAHIPLAQDVDIVALAHPYDLTGGQIRNGILLAVNRALSLGSRVELTQSLLERSAQDQLRADVGDMAEQSQLSLRMENLVLPNKEESQIREILDACRVRTHVLTHWGFGKRISTGKGMTLLFSGEPGTGKTLCAEILAAEMDTPLFRVSVPRIMSKWVGETEKNIEEVFKKAKGSHSMLLFDEADSLFTNRVKVENSVDRFANMETNLLLQEIERFEGVVILTTNHEKNIDDAFQRRIQFKVSFPFPDAEQRSRIWETLIPPECPVEELDFHALGEAYELSGGYIKNAVLKAAYRAAIEESPMSMDHIEAAAEQECRNAGKIFQSIQHRKVESLF